jgi:hypothetical protein
VAGKEAAVPAPATVAGAGDGGIAPDLPVVKVSGPADLVNLIPWVLRFRPGEGDLVVIGVVPPRGRVKLSFRWDLPGSAFQARRAVAALAAAGCTRVLIAGFGPGSVVALAVAQVRQAAEAAGLAVGEALRVEGERCWSYLCTDASCCPPEGRPCGPAGSPVAAAFQAAGAPAPLASRAVLAAFISPAIGAEAEAMRQAMRRAEARAGRLIRRGLQPGREQARTPLVNSGVRAVATALRAYQGGGSITSHDELAWLIRVLDGWEVRNKAWLRMDPVHRDAHRRLWTDLARLATDGYEAAPASLLALVAWQDGDGAFANLALDRALAAQPGYSMARLLRDAIDCGAPPGKADPAPIARALSNKARRGRAATRAGAAARRPGARPATTTTTRNEEPPMDHDALTDFGKVSLDRLKLAADVILSEADAIPDSLEVEVVLFRERVERALLLPGKPAEAGG